MGTPVAIDNQRPDAKKQVILINVMNYIIEQREWNEKLANWFTPDARLVSVSSHSSDIRVYRADDTVIKLRRLTPATVFNRPNSLEDEYLVLCWLRDTYHCDWLPAVKDYRREGLWEMMSMEALEPPVCPDPVASPLIEGIRDVWAVICRVWQLNKMGVSHGDLLQSNVGPTIHGKIVMLDFDQVMIGSRRRCFLRDFFGVPLQGRAAQFTIWDRMMNSRGFRALFLLPGKIRARFRCGRVVAAINPSGVVNRCKANGNPGLMALAEIWVMSAKSGANSPEGAIAYYSIDIAGIHFPGERPWVLRWEMIQRKVNFAGKRVVELGCNLGLLSVHASLAGAGEVVGADHNDDIIEAAKKTAVIFNADVKFFRANFDDDMDWETRLGGGDIVTVLSLTYWLRDKDRLWRYLGWFSEVLFEGHEAPEETELRFKQAGFSRIERIGISERNRIVFHATRQLPGQDLKACAMNQNHG